MRRKSLKTKIGLICGIGICSTVLILTAYSSINSRNAAINAAENEVVLAAEKYSQKIEGELEIAMDASNTMSNLFASLKKDKTLKLDREGINEFLKEQLQSNSLFFGSYTLWEPNTFDKKDNEFINKAGHDSTGRFIPYWTLNQKKEFVLEPLTDYTKPGPGDYYQIPKNTKNEALIDPYLYPVNGKDVLMCSFVTPIKIRNEFYGIAGIDVTIDFLQNLVENAKKEIIEGKTYISIISNNGTYAANTLNPEQVGKKINNFYTDAANQINIIKEGKKQISRINDFLEVRIPITIGKTTTPWQVRISIPSSEITYNANIQMLIQLLIGLLLIIIGTVVILYVLKISLKPLFDLIALTKTVAEGQLDVEISTIREDEIGELSGSFDNMIKKIREIVSDIRKGASNVAAASTQIASLAQSIAQGSNEQTSSAEQVTASIKEMIASINQNSDNAKITEQVAIKATQGMLKANSAFKDSIDAMNQIADKLFIMIQIANQTDQLAIKAGIEADLAGEHGKGFAVVVQEFRTLAENAKNAAKVIEEVIDENLKTAFYSGKLLTEIVPEVQKTSQLVLEISSACLEQNTGTVQINSAIQQLNSVTEANTTSAGQLAISSEELAAQAEALNKDISFFTLNS